MTTDGGKRVLILYHYDILVRGLALAVTLSSSSSISDYGVSEKLGVLIPCYQPYIFLLYLSRGNGR
jgi:hypothetical protein